MLTQSSQESASMIRHFKDFDPRLGEVVSELCHEFGLADDAFGHGVSRIDGYPKFPRSAQVRKQAFLEQLAELSDGTFIFIDNPAEPSPELETMGHVGYEDVAEDRISCLQTLTNPELYGRLEDLNIQLISYKDL